MNTLFMILAAIALLGLLLSLFKPGCGFLGLCKKSRWMPVVIWLIIFLIALVLWRNWAPSGNEPEMSLMPLNTATEQNTATSALDEPGVNNAATEPQTLKERIDKTVDNAAGAAADTYNATRDKVNEFGQAASEAWEEVRESTGKTLEKAGDSIEETGKEIQEEDTPNQE